MEICAQRENFSRYDVSTSDRVWNCTPRAALASYARGRSVHVNSRRCYLSVLIMPWPNTNRESRESARGQPAHTGRPAAWPFSAWRCRLRTFAHTRPRPATHSLITRTPKPLTFRSDHIFFLRAGNRTREF